MVRERDRNQNPEFSRITFDGKDWASDDVPVVRACKVTDNDFATCDKAFQHRIAAAPTAQSFETGTNEFGEVFAEQVVVQYFATEGIFESDFRTGQSPEDKWVARKQASGQDITFWFVVRDDRGGVSWTTRTAHVD
jgi:hypothetical protein